MAIILLNPYNNAEREEPLQISQLLIFSGFLIISCPQFPPTTKMCLFIALAAAENSARHSRYSRHRGHTGGCTNKPIKEFCPRAH